MIQPLRIPVLAAALLAVGIGLASPLAAQSPAPPDGEVVDRVVAVVGDSVVLQSDIEEEIVRLIASGQTLPDDPTAIERIRGDILNRMVEELLIIQAAERDSIEVSESDVSERVEQDIQQRIQRYPSERAFEEDLQEYRSMTISELRESLAQQHRRTMLLQRYIATLRRDRQPPPVTESELRQYFEENRDRFGERPATISFRQLVVPPQASDSAREAARTRAEEVLQRIREGEDFERLAERYSDDEGSADQGGDLGWIRPSEYERTFADVVRFLRPGQISGVVETSLGFHIVRLERARGSERQASHILIRPERSDDDPERARRLAEDLVERIRAGESMRELQEEYGDPDEDTRFDSYPLGELPEPYASALTDAEPGSVIGPLRLSGDGVEKWVILQIEDRAEAGQFSFADVREQLRQQLEQQRMIEELVDELRSRTHVEIRR